MVDFTESFKKGIANAKRAEREKAEIIQLFKTLKDQISKVTDGNIEVYLGNKKSQTKDRCSTNSSIDSIIRDQINFSKKNQLFVNKIMGLESEEQVSLSQSDAILASSIVNGNRYTTRVIAEWKSDQGYPCKIFYDGLEREVFDKKSLEGVLSDMISSPVVGSIFQTLLSDAEKS
ncbi:hypothetical protein [Ignatzschineria cameli]|uniref:Uncharacterized protein n=1 Tax=Ignatzschineria cameli TaxID=2182793 RepID=A0A2U2AQ91_9GAMM|nr:hypothetical protein [Ignatzschineria cameli]PWD85805.1 hypothetical protein DC077_07155 [Ignatzschineria cameli]PWD89433.1 hypothetical protein DC079_06780 [Ignatzschineria cameli]PWD90905.1 hypothetical protein DC081_06490 [Ignatzschineria cameli]PWD91693.1 hypothetical protein DC078_06775 [Ignatzschineria cameli]